ncbi:hypothetical protein F4780DRAFT_756416, partial [Xylariomycetidae sp. FL0641]
MRVMLMLIRCCRRAACLPVQCDINLAASPLTFGLLFLQHTSPITQPHFTPSIQLLPDHPTTTNHTSNTIIVPLRRYT